MSGREEKRTSASPAKGVVPAGAAAHTPSTRPKSWWYEIPVFYLLLWAVQRAVFPELPGFREVNPNPYWLGVLVFGLRYGIGAGVLSGAASAALFAWGARQAGEGFRLQDADFWLQPGLFVVLGASLGGVADAWWHRIVGLERRIEDFVGRTRGLQNQIQTQQKAMRAVEQQVVSQMSSVVTLYHGSRELGRLDRDGLYPAMTEFFTRALQATKAGVYVRVEGRLELADSRGWASEDEYPRSVEVGQGVVGRAASERRVISLRDLFVAAAEVDSGAPAGAAADAIMAAPLLDPDGQVAAVFAVHAMPFLRFNSASVNLLTLLAEWGTESLAKILHVEQLRGRSLLDEDYAVHSPKYFQTRTAQEFARSQRYALPFSVLLVSPDLGEVPKERRGAALRTISRVLRETAREIDIVAKTPLEEAPFGVLMMTATRDSAHELRDRVLEAFKRLEFPAKLRVGVGSFSHAMTRTEELLEQARAELG